MMNNNNLEEELTQKANYLERYQVLLLAVDIQLRKRQIPDNKQLKHYRMIAQDYKRKFHLMNDREAIKEIQEYCRSVEIVLKKKTKKNDQ